MEKNQKIAIIAIVLIGVAVLLYFVLKPAEDAETADTAAGGSSTDALPSGIASGGSAAQPAVSVSMPSTVSVGVGGGQKGVLGQKIKETVNVDGYGPVGIMKNVNGQITAFVLADNSVVNGGTELFNAIRAKLG